MSEIWLAGNWYMPCCLSTSWRILCLHIAVKHTELPSRHEEKDDLFSHETHSEASCHPIGGIRRATFVCQRPRFRQLFFVELQLFVFRLFFLFLRQQQFLSVLVV